MTVQTAGIAHTLQVTPDNFVRAETDMQFMTVVKRGGFGRLVHEREFPPAGRQPVAWADADVLRSRGVFDLELGPVVITLPSCGDRFMSLEVLDEDHYTLAMFYGPGTYSFSFDNVSTRYMLVVLRLAVDPSNRADMAAVHGLQEAIVVSRPRPGGGRFVIPNWDPVSQARVRVALQLLGNTLSGDERTFGARDEVDPVRHLIGTATRWDRCPPRDIAYLHCVPRHNDGVTAHALRLRHVPVDGFWSLSVYDSGGHFLCEDAAGRVVNSRTAVPDTDGSIALHFGAPGHDNCLAISRGWCYVVRLYRPRAEILGGKWKFPEAEVTQMSAGSLS